MDEPADGPVDGPAAEPELRVLFPVRIARFGVFFFAALLALFVGWVRTAEEMPWLAVVAGTGCFLAALMSLGQLIKPKVLAEANRHGLVIYSRRLEGGNILFRWQDVRDMSYEERQVGQFLHKVIRLHFDHEIDAGLRQIKDQDNIAHLDAFAAEPGGRELLERLEVLRSRS